MTPSEWKDVADEVRSLWGKSQKWDGAPQAYRYARNVPFTAAMRAIEHLYLERHKNAPAPADILGAARQFIDHSASRREVDEYCAASGHLWAIVWEHLKMRTVVCARCGQETTGSAWTYPTEGEIENGSNVAPSTTERIAP